MLFIEPRFLGFFVIVCVVHWMLRSSTMRKLWLVTASYAFYAAWDWRFLTLIAASTLIDFTVGLLLARDLSTGQRRVCLWFSIAGNLGILGFFKYCNFFTESAAALASSLGVPLSAPTLNIILPVGISFYTFQTLSYSIDVYRGRLAPTKSILDMALFVAFFPQLVAGPIVRACDFLPQLRRLGRFANVEVRACLTLFLIGYIKKACISDNIAPTVDAFFAAPADFAMLSAWLAVVLYAIQIYCDFSGYTDMAIACAGFLGYRLNRNFDFPYFATSVTDFWRRWHISLSTWLRDYVYISLGGSRCSKLLTHRNLLITMLLGGLWHGAAWHFVLWGGLHGVALIAHKQWTQWRERRRITWQPPRLVAMIATFAWVCLAWAVFRSPDMPTLIAVLRACFVPASGGLRHIDAQIAWLVVMLIAVHWVSYRGRVVERLQRAAHWVFAGWYSLASSLAIALLPPSYRAFIYFQF